MIFNTVDNNLRYEFEQDIINLAFISTDKKSIFKVINGQTPTLLNEVIKKNINIKTLYILNDIMEFFTEWTKEITDDKLIWLMCKYHCENCQPSIEYDKKKFKEIIDTYL
jgi:hypothetical protein